MEAVLARVAREAGRPALQAAAIVALLGWNSHEGRRLGLALLNDEEAAYDPAALAEFTACPLDALLPLISEGLAQPEPEARRQVLELLLPIERAKELARTTAGPNLIALALQDSDRFVRAHAVRLRDAAITFQSGTGGLAQWSR